MCRCVSALIRTQQQCVMTHSVSSSVGLITHFQTLEISDSSVIMPEHNKLLRPEWQSTLDAAVRPSRPNAHDEVGEDVTVGGGGDSILENVFMMPMLLSDQSVMVTLSNDRGVPSCSPSSLGVLIPASCLLRGPPVLEGRHVPGAAAFCQQASLTVAPRRQ